MKSCLTVVTDLIFATRIRGAVLDAGWEFRQIRDQAALEQAAPGAVPDLVLVDMNAEGIESVSAIRYTKAHWPGARVVAFYAHVQTSLRDAALEAGADDVLARSQFVGALADLLS
ncbi:MAG: response regulator [Phycisphaerae bacterium]|nr:response regulator [Phycisphaerae bacterium]